ncbi:MAG: GNAT family N-acetyltransferase [Anaerolineae bacterium]|nr:GNAT family N-acetyltransferase [Anaerolineae bacterium]
MRDAPALPIVPRAWVWYNGATRNCGSDKGVAMIQCVDLDRVREFCREEPVRYRHILHQADSPCPELDEAMLAAGVLGGPAAFFADACESISVLACVSGQVLQLEGAVAASQRAELTAWCRELAPKCAITTSADLKGLLTQALDISEPERWQRNGEYTVTEDELTPRITRPVRTLMAADRPMWQDFIQRHPREPLIWPGLGGSGAGVRDFELMAQGLPVDVYVTEWEGEITGVLTVRPLTRMCDEVSMMFVDQEHRRRGNAHSLLSEATHDIFGRGRMPGYSAQGNRTELVQMLSALGYVFITYRWIADLT